MGERFLPTLLYTLNYGLRSYELSRLLHTAAFPRKSNLQYFFHEMTASATTVVEEKLTLLFRVEEEIQHVRELVEDLLNERILQDVYKVVFEPFVKSAPSACHRPSLTETCQCLFELKR